MKTEKIAVRSIIFEVKKHYGIWNLEITQTRQWKTYIKYTLLVRKI